MDLTSAITGLQSANTMAKVQMAVARKVLDVEQYQGDAAVKLIEAASNGASQAGDALTAASIGLGGQIDTYA
jgi:hypothetical protein